jgi:hypothetical protein
LHECHVITRGQRVAAEVQRTGARSHGVQRHQILPVGADIHHIVINGVFVGVGGPLQGTAGHVRGYRKAVVDAGFDLGSFFVVIPRHQLQTIKLVGGVVEAVNFVKGLQPGVAALLGDNAILSPRRQSVVETFVGRADSFFLGRGQTRLVEFRQVAHPEIGADNYPRIAATAHGVRETATVLKNEVWVSAGGRFHRVPVDGVVQVDIKIGDHGPSVDPHVCGRRYKGLFYVLHLFDQRLLRRTALTRTQLDGALVHHDGKSEAGMLFDFRHHRQRSLIGESVPKSVPVDNHALNTAADHVRNLTVDLRRILGVVTNAHMAWIAKPGHQMRVHLGTRSGIQE